MNDGEAFEKAMAERDEARARLAAAETLLRRYRRPPMTDPTPDPHVRKIALEIAAELHTGHGYDPLPLVDIELVLEQLLELGYRLQSGR